MHLGKVGWEVIGAIVMEVVCVCVFVCGYFPHLLQEHGRGVCVVEHGPLQVGLRNGQVAASDPYLHKVMFDNNHTLAELLK